MPFLDVAPGAPPARPARRLAGPLIVVLIAAAFLGLPIFIVLGGIGFLLFAKAGQPLEIIPNQAYTVLTGNAIPAIPLFAAVGFFLSESKAGERMVRFFQAVFGWFPGGLTVMAVLVCAFFTTFTGASGVTILALGGLLAVILEKAGYPKKFTVGPSDRLREHRPALPAEPARHHLRRDRPDEHQGHVRGRASCPACSSSSPSWPSASSIRGSTACRGTP